MFLSMFVFLLTFSLKINIISKDNFDSVIIDVILIHFVVIVVNQNYSIKYKNKFKKYYI